MSQALCISNYDQQADRLAFFQQMILSGLRYWQDHAAFQNMDVALLDRERESILNALTRGLEFDQAWPQTLKLIDKLAAYMERRGYWTVWRTVLEQAVATSQRVGDIQGETTMTALLARLSQRQSRGEDVARYYWRAMRLAKQSDNQYEYARICCNLGYYFIDAGRWWRAEVLSLRALEVFEELGSEHGQAHTYNHLGLLHTRQRRWSEAENDLKIACTLWEKLEDEHSIIYGYENLGILFIEMGQPTNALTWLDKAHKQVSRTGDKAELANIMLNIGMALSKKGDRPLARSYFEQAEDAYHYYGNHHGLALVWGHLGVLDLRQENFAEATINLQKSRDACNRLHDVDNELKALIHLIECETLMGMTVDAEHHLIEAEATLALYNLGQQGAYFKQQLVTLRQGLLSA